MREAWESKSDRNEGNRALERETHRNGEIREKQSEKALKGYILSLKLLVAESQNVRAVCV